MASKIIYVIVAMAMLNLGLLLFSCSTWNGTTGECKTIGETTNSTVWEIMKNPTATGSDFWNTLFGSGWGLLAVLGTVTLTTVVVGSTIFGKQIETIIYIAIGIGLASVVYPSIKLFQLLQGLSMVGDNITRTVLSIVFASVLFIAVLFTVLDWARGRE